RSIGSRLQRMFSQTGGRSKDGEKARRAADTAVADVDSSARSSKEKERSISGEKRPEIVKKSSDTSIPTVSSKSKGSLASGAVIPPRFVINPDGTHEHNLRSTKRQEKLSDMLRDLVGGGKKRDDHGPPERDGLSLMSSWVDQLRSEKDK